MYTQHDTHMEKPLGINTAKDNPAIKHFEEKVSEALCGIEGTLLATVSGGADSMALLHCLRRTGKDFAVANCNFHLRGSESDRDSKFVEWICRKYSIPLYKVDFDVEEDMRKNGGSMEMSCRRLRYDWFRQLKAEKGFSRILTAHHRDDNTETMLLNMMRGCGIEGLKAMIADTGEIARPLLCLSRQEIERYLEAIGEKHITDSSNLTDEPDRNFIRLKVMPLLRDRWENIDKRLALTRRNAERTWLVTEQYLTEAVEPDGSLPCRAILESASPVTLIHFFLKDHGVSPAVEEEIRASVIRGATGKKWFTTDGNTIYLDKEGLRVFNDNDSNILSFSQEELPGMPSREKLRGMGPWATLLPRALDEYRLRPWREGERIRPMGMRGTRLVSDLLREGGIPVPCRKKFQIVADAATDEVIWVPGCRRSASDAVDPKTHICFRVVAQLKNNI